MWLRALCLCCLAALLCACAPRTFGPKETSTVAGSRDTLERGKKIFLAVDARFEAGDDVPEEIARYISTLTKPYAESVLPASSALSRQEALAQAATQSADYLFLLDVRQWRSPSYTHVGSDAVVHVEVIDPASGEMLLMGNFNARCYAALVGMTQSAGACLRPEYEKWLSSVFAIPQAR